jgi:CubicO group peptidase (beta-lactamase class C family)
LTNAIPTDSGLSAATGLLSAWIEAQIAHDEIPGLAIGIVHDQALVWARGFGRADVEGGAPATPDTLYRIASITKLFTSTAVLILRDEGKLQLDDPLGRHLPWFTIGDQHAGAPPITIRHLLTHTAGLTREAGFPYWTDGNFPTAEQIRERLPSQGTVLPAETRWKYSNLGLALAGEVVAAVSGRPYAEYVAERVLEPLGMRRTWVATPPPDLAGLATGYTRRLPGASRQRAPFTDARGITPAANMTTSVTDLARFAMLQFRDGPAGGPQVLRGATLREMQRVHWLEPGWAAGWGLGFRITRERGRTYVGHGGRLRGYRSQISLRPDDRIGVIVLINAADVDPYPFVDKAFQWVAPALVSRPEPAPAAPDPAWQRYLGRYRSPWADLQVLVVDGGLAMIDPTQPDPALTLTRLHPVGEHTFRMENADGFATTGELLVFELGADGRVSRVKVGDNYITPVGEW